MSTEVLPSPNVMKTQVKQEATKQISQGKTMSKGKSTTPGGQGANPASQKDVPEVKPDKIPAMQKEHVREKAEPQGLVQEDAPASKK